jgi:hypothetical protein
LGREGQKNFSLLRSVEQRDNLLWQRKALRQDADDFISLSVDEDGLADHVRVAAETSRPHAVGQEGRRREPGQIFVRCQQPTESRTSAEHWKKIRGDANDAHSFRLALPGQVVVAANRDRNLLKPMMRSLDIEILRRGKPVLGDAQAGRSIPQDHQPVCIVVWQRTKQQRICDAKDGSVRSNPDRQRQHRYHCEPRVLCEGAKSESNILRPLAH